MFHKEQQVLSQAFGDKPCIFGEIIIIRHKHLNFIGIQQIVNRFRQIKHSQASHLTRDHITWDSGLQQVAQTITISF